MDFLPTVVGLEKSGVNISDNREFRPRHDRQGWRAVQIAARDMGDTTTPVGRLIVTIIGGIAEFERELIRARTGEGIRRAGEETLVEIARTYNVSHMTISRLKTQPRSVLKAGEKSSVEVRSGRGGYRSEVALGYVGISV
jgi:hypothetical protein